MLCRARQAFGLRQVLRTYASSSSAQSLVFLEHHKGQIDSGSLSAVTAASKLGGSVTGLLVGAPDDVQTVLDKAKRIKGLTSILHASSPSYAEPVPETLSPFLLKLLGDSNSYTHVICPPTSLSKSLFPRVAAVLNLPMISDALSIEHDASSNVTTFTRPIYAGNAIATVKAPSSVPIKLCTVRSTSFDAAAFDDSHQAEVKQIDAVEVQDSPTEHVKTTIVKSDRPDLGVASRVVSGGRPLKNAETFEATMYPLAEVLGAAVGASRAAVDAGYADNSLQVGQTGKVVAPELYIAVGISGAIQHLAGMKDSKLIVAINKDPEAPIFQVADIGLVGDLYTVVPELVEKLKAAK